MRQPVIRDGVCDYWRKSWLRVVKGLQFRTRVSAKCQKNELKPWQVKEWIIPRADADYVCAVEAVPDVYEREYNQAYLVVGLN